MTDDLTPEELEEAAAPDGTEDDYVPKDDEVEEEPK